MIKIGITGGIGSGKSVVAALLSMMGVPVYPADSESKRLADASPDIRQRLQALFGNDIYKNGRLDRQRLASLIFTDETLLQQVNGIIHPVVKQDFRTWQQSVDSFACAIESAVLYESGFENEVDCVLLVYAPETLRIERAMKRDSVAETDVRMRMNRQLPDVLKRPKADCTVINDGVKALLPQVEAFMETVRRMNSSPVPAAT